MKVINRIQIEYVVPENDAEAEEIRGIIQRFEAERSKPVDFSKLKLVKATRSQQFGYWRPPADDVGRKNIS